MLKPFEGVQGKSELFVGSTLLAILQMQPALHNWQKAGENGLTRTRFRKSQLVAIARFSSCSFKIAPRLLKIAFYSAGKFTLLACQYANSMIAS